MVAVEAISENGKIGYQEMEYEIELRNRFEVLNLLSNAVKFSRREAQESPGRVDLRIEYLSDTQMTISVADNGIGISEEDIDALFCIICLELCLN